MLKESVPRRQSERGGAEDVSEFRGRLRIHRTGYYNSLNLGKDLPLGVNHNINFSGKSYYPKCVLATEYLSPTKL